MNKDLNKKSLYILIPTVLVIWGIVIHRVTDFKTTENVPSTHIDTPSNTSSLKTPKRLKLSLNYRDPFGISNDKIVEKKPSATTKKKSERWPPVNFVGTVSAPATEKLTTIISIDNKQYFFGIGESINQITLLHTWQDSIQVSYKNSLPKTLYR